MLNQAHSVFDQMDRLSTLKSPFFFICDFMLNNVNVYTEKDLADNGIMIDFESVKSGNGAVVSCRNFVLQSFPEDKATYKKGFEIVQNNLKLGNSYLANYTCKTEIKTNLSLKEIFKHSKAKYKVLFGDQFVFFSPETFIEINEQQIATHPMKGTIDAAVENAIEELKNDQKEKAEHYTVVDLLRNDLSMVADNVCVTEFQRIDFISSPQRNLYTMSSEICGTLKPSFQNKIGSILKTLLPAGSILGAPKQKTLEIILEAESQERGFYTGVCGWFDGKNLDSCVMIRFIEKENDKLFFRSGGGVTHLSKLDDEYQEMKNKIYVPIH